MSGSKWIAQLASDIESKYGKEARDRIFGDIDVMKNNPEFLSTWFENFTSKMDALGDKEFLRLMMANRCPCGGDNEDDGRAIKGLFDNSKTLNEFTKALKNWYMQKYSDGGDDLELRGNVLYLTKPLSNSEKQGRCGKGCHCWLAMHTNKKASDIFCHCCTIGHTGRPFQVAFGNDIKMEFIESIICGGSGCTMTVHLPEKATSDLALCKHGFNIYCEMLATPTGFEVVHEESYSYITGNPVSPTMVIFDVNLNENQYQIANDLAHLISSKKVSNWLELVRDDVFFEALKKAGFTITQQDLMMVTDITDYAADFSHDDMIRISVVQSLDELKHWIEINRGYFGDLYSERQWAEIHTLSNVTMYLAKYNGIPVSSMLTITGGSACVELVHTIPDYRKKGIASVMIGQALSDLKAKGISKVTVQTGAADLFEKMGFSVVCEKYVAKM